MCFCNISFFLLFLLLLFSRIPLGHLQTAPLPPPKSPKIPQHRSEGFPRTGYFIPGRVGTGAWRISGVVRVTAGADFVCFLIFACFSSGFRRFLGFGRSFFKKTLFVCGKKPPEAAAHRSTGLLVTKVSFLLKKLSFLGGKKRRRPPRTEVQSFWLQK